ncbi:unnamed protein product [Coffea canephora]|uniref:BZIP domain-containing protein n=1 Tax=Coffea canephora TaxID=49390 RepID=A0A068U073_COFCA|nr:unnamed protein product [Coffea canephora]
MSCEEPVHFHFPPVLEDPFTCSDLHDLVSLIQSGFPTHANSGSETTRNGMPSNSTSGSETNRSVYSVEERKRRRMISNRDSARRSRLRKKKQLEELTNQMNQLKLENTELKNQLCLVSHQYRAVQMDSTRLMAESIDLRQKLANLNQILVNMQLPSSLH